MTHRRTIIVALVAVVIVAVGVLITWDRDHLEPDRDAMEALVGTSLEAPRYTSWNWVDEVRIRITSWVRYWSSPIPNQMEMWPMGDVWTYSFQADSTYHPPSDSPLDCQTTGTTGTLSCEAEQVKDGQRWRYWLRFDPQEERGFFTAQLP